MRHLQGPWDRFSDPFEAAWPLILVWLEAEPERTAIELLGALQATQPDAYPNSLLRTLQRRIKTWREAKARGLVLAVPDVLGRHPTPSRPRSIAGGLCPPGPPEFPALWDCRVPAGLGVEDQQPPKRKGRTLRSGLTRVVPRATLGLLSSRALSSAQARSA